MDGFFDDGRLKKISVDGGSAVTLCEAPAGRGASWGEDGNIILSPDINRGLVRVPSAGGTPVPVTKLKPGEFTHRWPQVLPGGQAILFTASTSAGTYDGADMDVISLNTGERKTVARGGFSGSYLPTSTKTGHLIYLHQSTLFAVAFDPSRLAATGSPVPILEDVSSNIGGGGDLAFEADRSVSETFIYLSGTSTGGPARSISWVDSSGKTEVLQAPPGPYVYYTPRFSPDGKRLAFAVANGQSDDIWVKDLDRDATSRLTFLKGLNRWPVWTSDGRNIVFQSTNPAAPGLYWIRSDGSGEAQRLTDGKTAEIPHSFSPDGKRLAFSQIGNGGKQQIFTALVEHDPTRGALEVRLGKPELFVGARFRGILSAFSPDGRWLAYQGGESGNFTIYVRAFPGREDSGRFRRIAAGTRCGPATGVNCFLRPRTDA